MTEGFLALPFRTINRRAGTCEIPAVHCKILASTTMVKKGNAKDSSALRSYDCFRAILNPCINEFS